MKIGPIPALLVYAGRFLLVFSFFLPYSVAGSPALDRLRLVFQIVPHVDALAVDPSGRFLVSRYQGLSLYSLEARSVLGPAKLGFDSPMRIDFISGGRWLLVHHAFGNWSLYDPSRNQVDLELDSSRTGIEGLDIAVNGYQGAALVSDSQDSLELVGAKLHESADGVSIEWSWRQPIDRSCSEVSVSETGALLLVRCDKYLLAVKQGGQQVARIPFSRPAASLGNEARTVWITPGGTHALIVSKTTKDRSNSLHWIDISEGSVTEVRGSDGSRMIANHVVGFAHLEAPIVFVVSADNQLIAVAPDESKIQWDIPDQADLIAYDRSRGIFLVAASGVISIWTRDGHVVGGIASTVRYPTGLATSEGDLYIRIPETLFSSKVYSLDLENARLVEAEEVSDNTFQSSLIESFNTEKGTVTEFRDSLRPFAFVIRGLPAGARMIGRSAPNWAIFEDSKRAYIVDLERRRLVCKFRRTDRAPVVAGLVSSTTYSALFIDDKGRIEQRRLSDCSKVSDYSVRLRDASSNSSFVELEAGEVIALVGRSAYIAPSAGSTDFERLDGINSVFSVVAPDDGSAVAFQGFGKSTVCPVNDQPFTAERCWQAVGDEVYFVGKRKHVVTRAGHFLIIWDRNTGDPLVLVAMGVAGSSIFVRMDTSEYKATPDGLGLAVFLGEDRAARPLERIDLVYNRPSSIVEALGIASDARVGGYRNLEQRRSERYSALRSEATSEPREPDLRVSGSIPISTRMSPIKLNVEFLPQSAGIHFLHVYVNGRPVYGMRGFELRLPSEPSIRQIEIPLAAGENRVAVTLSNERSGRGVGGNFVTTYIGELSAQRQLFLLAVGVSSPGEGWADLNLAEKDVVDVTDAFRRLLGTRLDARLVVGSDASRQDILSNRSFLERAGPNDTVVVYLAGHGQLSDDDQFVFAAYDARAKSPYQGALTYADLEELIDGLGAKSVVVFIDACYSGEQELCDWMPVEKGRDGIRARGFRHIDGSCKPGDRTLPELNSVFADLREGTGATIIASATKSEVALEIDRIGNGLFTHAVLNELLEGQTADVEGQLTIRPLLESIRRVVSKQSGGVQRPNVKFGDIRNAPPLVGQPPLKTLREPNDEASAPVKAFGRSSNHRRLALVFDGIVEVVDLHSASDHRVFHRQPNHECQQCQVHVSDDGARVVLFGKSNFEVLTADLQWSLGTSANYNSVMSPDGRFLVASDCSSQRKGALFDLDRRVQTTVEGDWACFDAFGPNGFIAADSRQIIELDPIAGQIQTIDLPKSAHQSIGSSSVKSEFSPGGRYIARLETVRDSDNGTLELISVENQAIVFRKPARWNTGYVVLSADGPVVLAANLSDFTFNNRPIEILDDSGHLLAKAESFLGNADSASLNISIGESRILMRAKAMKPLDFAAPLETWGKPQGTRYRAIDSKTGQRSGWLVVPGIPDPSLLFFDANRLAILDGSNGGVWVFDGDVVPGP